VKGERIGLSGLIGWGYCTIAEMVVGGVCRCYSCSRGYLYSDRQKGLLRLFVYVAFYIVYVCLYVNVNWTMVQSTTSYSQISRFGITAVD